MLPYSNGRFQLKEVTSDPPTGTKNQLILNTSSNQIKIWYSGQWQVLHTLVPPMVNIKQGQPMGLLLALTYANDVT